MKIKRNIDVVTEISCEDFRKNYLKPQKPLVIKGIGYKFPAGWKWSVEYLQSACGDVEVELYDNNNKNKASAYTKGDLRMKFGEYLGLVIKEKASNLRLFLFNMFKRKPELQKDFPCPEIFRGILGKIGYMFFGCKGAKVRIHQDIDMSNVLLTQFQGRKRVVIFSPKYSDLLYRLPFNTYSLIDPDNVDYDKYPGLEYVEGQECILEHGDALFMPSGYWHYITYLDNGFGVSYRKIAQDLKTKWIGISSIVLLPVDKLMNMLLGPAWLMRKEQMAQDTANKAIEKITGHKPYIRSQLRIPGF
jgi:hypothetical protein